MDVLFIIGAWIVGCICTILVMKYRSKRITKLDTQPVDKESVDEKEKEEPEKPLTDWENSTVNYIPSEHIGSVTSSNGWTFNALFDKIGIKVKEVRPDSSYLIAYEGGTFFFEEELAGEYVNLVFFNICFTNYRFLHKALMVANELNLKYDIWRCSVKILPDGYNERPVRASLRCHLRILKNQEDMEIILRETLNDAFRIGREFDESFKKAKSVENFDCVSAENSDFYNKIAFMDRRKDITHGKFTPPAVPESERSMLLHYFLRHFELSDTGKVVKMRLIYADCVETFEDETSISTFDLYSFLKKEAENAPIEQLNIDICYEKQTFSMKACRLEGSTPKTLYYMVHVTQLPLAGTELRICSKAKSYQTIIEVSLADNDAAYWEVKYMLDDAKDKVRNNQKDQLTDEQRMMLAAMDKSLQYDMYLGKKMYNDKAYCQALEHFMKVFRFYETHWKKVTMQDKRIYRQVALFIGFIYMEWNLPEKAYYYLTIAKEGGSIASMQEYINSLCQLHDPRVVNELSGYMVMMLEIIKQSEKIDESVNSFYAFLCKRMAYSLIELDDLDQAELFLHQMIKGHIEMPFAKDELDYITAIRLERSHQWEDSTDNKEKQTADQTDQHETAEQQGDSPADSKEDVSSADGDQSEQDDSSKRI